MVLFVSYLSFHLYLTHKREFYPLVFKEEVRIFIIAVIVSLGKDILWTGRSKEGVCWACDEIDVMDTAKGVVTYPGEVPVPFVTS